MTTSVLVPPEWLEKHMYDPAIRVVEVDVSRLGYDEWHVPGAVLWDVYRDLKDAGYRTVGAAATERLLARSGIGPDSTVVCYGYAPALGCWLLKLYGHPDVRILDCSRDTWRRQGRPAGSQALEPAGAGYVLPEPDGTIRADHVAVRDAIGAPRQVIVDVRSWDEYRGERFWPSGGLDPAGRAGHVPSAVHQPIDGLYDEHGSFRAATDLRQVFSRVELDGQDELITYCTIGGRASTAWFVLSYLLGRDHVRVYDGSWAEWGRLPGTPVEQVLRRLRGRGGTRRDRCGLLLGHRRPDHRLAGPGRGLERGVHVRGQDQARGQRVAGRGLADGPDETQERVVGVDLEHDGRLVRDDAEGVRHTVRQGDVIAGADREGLLAAAHGQPARDQVKAVVQVGVDVQRSAAAGGDGRLDDHRLVGLRGPDDHQRIEEPVGFAGSGRGSPGGGLVGVCHCEFLPLGCAGGPLAAWFSFRSAATSVSMAQAMPSWASSALSPHSSLTVIQAGRLHR